MAKPDAKPEIPVKPAQQVPPTPQIPIQSTQPVQPTEKDPNRPIVLDQEDIDQVKSIESGYQKKQTTFLLTVVVKKWSILPVKKRVIILQSDKEVDAVDTIKGVANFQLAAGEYDVKVDEKSIPINIKQNSTLKFSVS